MFWTLAMNVEVSVQATWIFDGLNSKVQKTSLSFLCTGIVHWPSKTEKWELGLNWERWAIQRAVKTLHLKWDRGWLSRHHARPFLQLLADFTKKMALKSRIMKYRSPRISQSRVLLLNRHLSVDLAVAPVCCFLAFCVKWYLMLFLSVEMRMFFVANLAGPPF